MICAACGDPDTWHDLAGCILCDVRWIEVGDPSKRCAASKMLIPELIGADQALTRQNAEPLAVSDPRMAIQNRSHTVRNSWVGKVA